MNKMSIGNRMKKYYEEAYKITLPMRMPVIIRIDGKAFHTLTRKFEKPFDPLLINIMDSTAVYLCEKIQGAQMAYAQSDEISILLHNYKKIDSQSWFGNELQKLVSVSAGMASSFFTKKLMLKTFNTDKSEIIYSGMESVEFDSRVFVIPETDVCNYFIWRQQDWERNSITMLAQSVYSHKELHKKKCSDMHEMLFQKEINWNNIPTSLKRGRCAVKGSTGKWCIDNEIPIFTKDREYIEKYLKTEED